MAALLLAATAFAQAPCQQSTPPSQQAPADQPPVVKDFEQRVQQYVTLRNAAKPGNPPKSSDVSKVTEHRETFQQRLIAARKDARQGEIFTPEIADYFKKQVGATLAGSRGAEIRASLKRAEPVHGIAIKINGRYPGNVPLQSTPPSLLLNLPQLPKELEYRFADRGLILRDKEANLIIDFIPSVYSETPAPAKPADAKKP